jgi:hypothetical protein
VALELFEVLERKLEQVLGQYQTLQNENATLMKMLEEQEKALTETREALGKMNKEAILEEIRLIDELIAEIPEDDFASRLSVESLKAQRARFEEMLLPGRRISIQEGIAIARKTLLDMEEERRQTAIREAELDAKLFEDEDD